LSASIGQALSIRSVWLKQTDRFSEPSPTTPTVLGAMMDWLMANASDPQDVAVAIEVPHGPVVEALMDRGFSVYAINPKQLDRFRDRFSPAGAKDDRRDALVLASSLRTDRHCFRRLEAVDPVVVELREWSRMADELKEERNRLTNRIRQQLWRYYPQALDLGEDPGADWFLDIWALAADPGACRLPDGQEIGRVLSANRIRRITASEALAILKRPALTVAPGTTDAAKAHISAVSERVRLVKPAAERSDTSPRCACRPACRSPGGRTGAAYRATRRGDPALFAGSGKDRPRHVARGGPSSHPGARLSRHPHFDRGCARHQAQRQVLSGGNAPGLLASVADGGYHWARVATQHDPRSKPVMPPCEAGLHSWPGPSGGRRSPPRRRLRHAADPIQLRPSQTQPATPQNRLIIGGEVPPVASSKARRVFGGEGVDALRRCRARERKASDQLVIVRI